MIERIKIVPIQKIGEDQRGSTFIFDTDRTGEFMVAHRLKGSVSGRHYHKGKSLNKNPEKIVIMKGEAIVNWFDLNTEKSGSINILKPSILIVEPWVWHEVIAIEDLVILELSSSKDGIDDIFRLTEDNIPKDFSSYGQREI